MRSAIKKLLAPSSIAIVGATPKPGAASMNVYANLAQQGFPGRVFLVNPKYQQIGDQECYPSLDALPIVPDAVFVGVAASHSIQIIEDAGRLGVRAAVLNASGFADGGPEGEELQRRLVQVANSFGMVVCGPNNMGFINLLDRVCMYTAQSLPPLEAGSVAVISQSGSIAIALSHDTRHLGLSYVITVGNQAVCTTTDYLEALLDDDRVKVILLFLETILDPAKFARAAVEAEKKGKSIVALKAGRSAGGMAAVAAHTGSLSGEDDVYDAFFRHCGVIRARDVDELIETGVLLSHYAEAPERPDVIAVTVSGGEAALVNDLGADFDMTFATLSPETLERMRPEFPSFSQPRNPVDVWGLGWNLERFGKILDALVAEQSAGIVMPVLDAPGGGRADVQIAMDMASTIVERAARHGKKFIFVNNSSFGGVHEDVKAILEPAGIPYLLGLRTAVATVSNWTSRSRARELPQPEPIDFSALEGLDGRDLMAAVARISGIPFVGSHVVTNADDVARITSEVGFPVVMKGLSDKVPHKTELNLVRLGLDDLDEAKAAFHEMSDTLAFHAADDPKAQVVIQPMEQQGVQLFLGARVDRQFGPVVVVGLGGTLVETMKQTSLRPGGPLSAAEARHMLSETPALQLIEGTRGQGPFDLDAAVDAIVRFSEFASGISHAVHAIEINPLLVRKKGRGVVALDLHLER